MSVGDICHFHFFEGRNQVVLGKCPILMLCSRFEFCINVFLKERFYDFMEEGGIFSFFDFLSRIAPHCDLRQFLFDDLSSLLHSHGRECSDAKAFERRSSAFSCSVSKVETFFSSSADTNRKTYKFVVSDLVASTCRLQ